MHKLTPCLWFDGNAEEAAAFYVGIIPGSRIDAVRRSPIDYPAGKAGDVLTVEFTLAGNPYLALNGGSEFKFSEAVSIQIHCDDQAEVERLANALSAVPEAEICGWVKDRYGFSWQIVPRALTRLMNDPDTARAARVMAAMMQMKRIDIAAIQRAAG